MSRPLIEMMQEVVEQTMGLERGDFQKVIHECQTGIYMDFFGQEAFLGANIAEAVSTVQRGDWWVEDRDGPLTEELRYCFSNRLSEALEEGSPWKEVYYANLRWALSFKSEDKKKEIINNIKYFIPRVPQGPI